MGEILKGVLGLCILGVNAYYHRDKLKKEYEKMKRERDMKKR